MNTAEKLEVYVISETSVFYSLSIFIITLSLLIVSRKKAEDTFILFIFYFHFLSTIFILKGFYLLGFFQNIVNLLVLSYGLSYYNQVSEHTKGKPKNLTLFSNKKNYKLMVGCSLIILCVQVSYLENLFRWVNIKKIEVYFLKFFDHIVDQYYIQFVIIFPMILLSFVNMLQIRREEKN